MNWKLLGIGGALVGALAVVLAGGFGRDPHAVPFMLTGSPAPAFNLRRVDTGEAVTLAALHGKPVVLNFWSTWCVPCQSEHPLMEAAAKQLGSRVAFVGVVYEDTEQNVKAFLEKSPSSLVQTLDERGTTAVDFGLAGVPETYFIDAAGRIRFKQVGPIDPETLGEKLKLIMEHG